MEKDEEKLLRRRFAELAENAETQNRYTYTDFLGLGELDIFHKTISQFSRISYTLFGGHESCERKVVRFGSAEEIGYDEEFPISCIRISALAPKFAESLTHRDYLGAIMNLGVQRKVLGDIFIFEKEAYVFCLDSIADYLIDEITRVKHTEVKAERTEEVPEEAFPKLVSCSIQIASERMDALLAAVFHLPRSKSQDLIKAGKVYIDGRNCESGSKVPPEGAVISLRGYGRFIYDGLQRMTRKGRLSVQVHIYQT